MYVSKKFDIWENSALFTSIDSIVCKLKLYFVFLAYFKFSKFSKIVRNKKIKQLLISSNYSIPI